MLTTDHTEFPPQDRPTTGPVSAVPNDAPVRAADRAIEWMLIALLAFSPLALGAVQAWSEMVVLCFASTLLAGVLWKSLSRRDRWRPAWSWTYLPVVMFLLLAAVQLLPLPQGVVGLVSPRTTSLKQELLGDLPGAAELLRRVTVSFCPSATRHDLSLVLAASAVFVAVSATVRTSTQVRRLLAAIAAIGGAFAVLALAQDATRADKIYWLIPTTPGGRADAGPFVNHSHFAQFMNLSAGAALGLLLIKLREIGREYHGGAGMHVFENWRDDPRVRGVVLLGVTLVAMLLAVALSMSRGGVLSTLAAGAFTGVMVAMAGRRRRAREREAGDGSGFVVVAIGLVAFCVLLYVGYDAVHERFAGTGDAIAGADAGRWQMLTDLRAAWAAFPAVGTGLGSHRYVFPLFDKSGLPNLAAHAENEYAQVLEEAGVVGLSAVLWFVGLICLAYARSVRGRRTVHESAFGLGYGLLAVIVHSFTDFGQHIPANACLSAATCGLLVSLSRMSDRRVHRGAPAPTPPTPKLAPVIPAWHGWAGFGVAAAVLVAIAVMLPGADAARRAESDWREAQRIEAALRTNGWQGTDDDYSALIADAAAAAAAKPADVEYAYGLALYRWQSITRDVDPPLSREDVLEYAARIVDDLHAARPLCPTFGPPYTLAGQIELFVLDRREAGTRHARTGYRLSPQDPTAAFVVGRLEATAGSGEKAALEALGHAVHLDPSLTNDVMTTLLDEAKRPEWAVALAGDDAAALFRVADELDRRKTDPAVAAVARAKAEALLKVRAERSGASIGELTTMAAIAEKQGDFAAAAVYWRRALLTQLTNVQWRMRLARCLFAAGDTAGARREVDTVLRAQPFNAEAMELSQKLLRDSKP